MATLAYASSYAGSSNLPAIELADRLSRITYPSITSFYFTSGGAEATDTSIKTARFTGRRPGGPTRPGHLAQARTRADAGSDERHRTSRLLAHVRAACAGIQPHRGARSVPLRESRSVGEPRHCRRQRARRGDPPRGTRDGRGVHRRTRPGRGRRHHSTRRLLSADPRDLRSARRAVHLRRGHHRVRAHGPMVRTRALRRRAGHHAVCERDHERLHPARRRRRLRRDPRGDRRRAAGNAGCTPACPASDVLRWPQNRDPRARAAGGAGGRAVGAFPRRARAADVSRRRRPRPSRASSAASKSWRQGDQSAASARGAAAPRLTRRSSIAGSIPGSPGRHLPRAAARRDRSPARPHHRDRRRGDSAVVGK